MATLIGRERELTRLLTFTAGARRRGGALLLHGPAGIGKSFLLASLCMQAHADGFVVLTASGVQSEARLSFAGLHQLLRPVFAQIGSLPPRQRDTLLVAFGMNEAAAPDPYLIALAALELLAVTAAAAPVLVVVDDAHWLDPPTATALAFVVRRLGDDAVAVVLCSRDGYATALHALDLPELTLAALDNVSAAVLLDQYAPHLEPRSRTNSTPPPTAHRLAAGTRSRSRHSSALRSYPRCHTSSRPVPPCRGARVGTRRSAQRDPAEGEGRRPLSRPPVGGTATPAHRTGAARTS